MVTTYAIPLWLIITDLSLMLSLLAFLLWSIFKVFNIYKSDKVIFIDKNDRFEIIYTKLKGKKNLRHKGSIYHLDGDAGLLNNKGKALYHFSEDKPTPCRITHSKVDWLDAESLNAMINNKIVQQIVSPQDQLTDLLFKLGAIGGILACISSAVVLLIVTGVINVGTI